MYYTIQSNILTLVLFVLLWLRTFQAWRQEGAEGLADYYPRFTFVVVIDILLTLLVYWILLAPQAFTMGEDYALYTFSNLCVHLFTPLFCLIDFILFLPSGKLKYRDVYAVLIFPLGYVLFTTIAGLLEVCL